MHRTASSGAMRYSINILGPHSICNEQESDDGFAMVFKVNQNAFKCTNVRISNAPKKKQSAIFRLAIWHFQTLSYLTHYHISTFIWYWTKFPTSCQRTAFFFGSVVTEVTSVTSWGWMKSSVCWATFSCSRICKMIKWKLSKQGSIWNSFGQISKLQSAKKHDNINLLMKMKNNKNPKNRPVSNHGA